MVKKIPMLARGIGIVYALVDDEDYDMLAGYAWHLHGNSKGSSWHVSTGVSYIGLDGKRKKVNVLMHHAIMGLPPIDHDIHHKNGDVTDNRKDNYEILHHDVHCSISGRTRK